MLKIHFLLTLIILMINYSTSQPKNFITNGGFQNPKVSGKGMIVNQQYQHWKYRNAYIVQVKQYNKKWPDQSTQVLLVNSQNSAIARPSIELPKGKYTLELDYSATQDSSLTSGCKILVMVAYYTSSFQTNIPASSYEMQHLKTTFTAKDQNNVLYITDIAKCLKASVIIDNVVINKYNEKSQNKNFEEYNKTSSTTIEVVNQSDNCGNLIVNGDFEAHFSEKIVQNRYFSRIEGWLSFGTLQTEQIFNPHTCHKQTRNYVLNPKSTLFYQMVDIPQTGKYWIEIDFSCVRKSQKNVLIFRIFIDRQYHSVYSRNTSRFQHEQYSQSIQKGKNAFVIAFSAWSEGYTQIDNVVLRKF